MSTNSITTMNHLLHDTQTSSMGAVGNFLPIQDLCIGLRVSKTYLSTILPPKVKLKIPDNMEIQSAIHIVKALATRNFSTNTISIYNRRITKNELTEMTKSSLGLKKLSLAYCFTLSDDDLQNIPAYCPELRKLTLINCPKISKKAVELLSKCNDLHIVSYTSNRGLKYLGGTKAFRENQHLISDN